MYMNHVWSNGCKLKVRLDVSSVYKNTTSLMNLPPSRKMPKIVLNTFYETKSVCFEAFSTPFISGSSSAVSSIWTKQSSKWLENASTPLLNLWMDNFKSANRLKATGAFRTISIIYTKPLTNNIKSKTLLLNLIP